MKRWLAYIGAYACACAVWYVTVFAIYTASRGAYAFDVAGLIIFAGVLPLFIAIIAFAFAYRAFSGRRFEAASWVIGGTLIVGIFVGTLIVVNTTTVPPVLLFIIGVGGTFVAGRVLTETAVDVARKDSLN